MAEIKSESVADFARNTYLEHRIGDKRIIHLIQKWLKAGVLDDGTLTVSEEGTGQGSVISPLLANVYLHYVFDLWAERWRQREAVSTVVITRYADDLVIGFERRADAIRFLAMMRKRFEKFALSLHPEKTRLIEFGRFAVEDRKRQGLGKPETFNFLGFTLICAQSRRGAFLLTRKTRRDRKRAKLREIRDQLRRRRHHPIPDQGRWLQQVIRGFFNYHAVPTNADTLVVFRKHVIRLWKRALNRRSNRDKISWDRIEKIAADWLPDPMILHPWPEERFAVKHPRWKPDARKSPVRFCAGGTG